MEAIGPRPEIGTRSFALKKETELQEQVVGRLFESAPVGADPKVQWFKVDRHRSEAGYQRVLIVVRGLTDLQYV